MSPERRTLLIGLAVFLAFSAYVMAFSPIAAWRLEARLQSAAEEAIAGRHSRWANVTVDGQAATLSGRWPNETAYESVIKALWSSEWSGGWLAGGITRIIDNSIAQPGEAASRIIAVSTPDGASLTGIAPGDAARTGLLDQALPLFHGRIQPRLAARSGNSNPDDWIEAAMALLTGLERLDQGSAILDSGTAVLYGVARSGDDAQQILDALAALPEGIRTVALILSDDDVIGGGATAEDFTMLLEAAFAMGRLRFNPGSASLSPIGRAGLEHVAAVISACPTNQLGISVRPVVSGDREAEALAIRRAEAVRSVLITFGVTDTRISVVTNADQDQLVRIVLDDEGES